MKENLISILKERFDKTLDLHPKANWDEVEKKLLKDNKLLETLCLMEETGGKVNLVDLPIFSGPVFLDCAKESPKGRRSLHRHCSFNTIYDGISQGTQEPLL